MYQELHAAMRKSDGVGVHGEGFRAPRARKLYLMPVLPRAETPEVFRGFGTGVLEKLHLDAARRRPSDGHIEKHNGVSSSDRLIRYEDGQR